MMAFPGSWVLRFAASRVQAVCAVMAGLYYFALMSVMFTRPFAPVPFGLSFNSMLAMMLSGRFDVDPTAIGYEGFVQNGRVVAYFGPFVSLLRLPLLLGADLLSYDITRVSCAVALGLAAFAKLRVVGEIMASAPNTRPVRMAWLAMVVAVLLGGPLVQFATASIYQEVANWSNVFVSFFVLFAMRILTCRETVRGWYLARLALLAGLALATRVTVGLALCLALAGLLLPSLVVKPFSPIACLRSLFSPGVVGPLLVLVVLVGFVGFVNMQRWSNPLTFADNQAQIHMMANSRYMRVLHEYGTFHPIRIPYALQYYFFPVWFLVRNGQVLFHAHQDDVLIQVHYPPATPLLSDPVLVMLAVLFLREMLAGRAWSVLPKWATLLVIAALSAPGLLMLTHFSVSYRYRLEFDLLIEFLAFLGLFLATREPAGMQARVAVWISALVLVGVAGSHLAWLTQVVSPIDMQDGFQVQDSLPRVYFWRTMNALQALWRGASP
jgi:hypothetical protein